MRFCQRVRDLSRNGEDLRQLERVAPHFFFQRLALDILHADKVSPVCFRSFDDAADVWVIEFGCRLGLAQQATVGVFAID